MSASVPVVLLIVAAAGFTLRAFWLAHRESRALRCMVAWLEIARAERWLALPWLTRRLLVVAGIEALRREGASEDREFAARYDEIRWLRRRKIIALLLGMAPIGVVLVGTIHWGWAW
jgi:hypothetical protein